MTMHTRRLFQTAALSLGTALLVSSCGLFSRLPEGPGVAPTSRAEEILLVASLGESDVDGAIESYLINPRTMQTTKTGMTLTPAPTFLTLDAARKTLYATNELSREATASAFAFDGSTGLLTPINSSLVLGAAPTYVSSADDKVVTANYGSGTITMMYREPSGALKQADWRIELGEKGVSHPHAVVFTPDGSDLFVTDLGLDRIFHFNVTSGIPPITIAGEGVTLPEGTGPRHFVFDKKGAFAYVIAEKRPAIFVFKRHGGELSLVQEVKTGGKGTGAHIALSPDGRYLYTSFRSGGDGIMIHSVGADGTLTYVGFTPAPAHPRQFALSPDGHFLAVASRDGGRVTLFERDVNFGTLRPTGITIPATRPVFVLWTTKRR